MICKSNCLSEISRGNGIQQRMLSPSGTTLGLTEILYFIFIFTGSLYLFPSLLLFFINALLFISISIFSAVRSMPFCLWYSSHIFLQSLFILNRFLPANLKYRFFPSIAFDSKDFSSSHFCKSDFFTSGIYF